MQVNFKTKNTKLGPDDEALMRKKIERLSRYLDAVSEAEIILSSEKNSHGPELKVAQLTVRANGTLFRAEEQNQELLSAFDAAVGKVERRISRFKDRQHNKKKGAPSAGYVSAPLPALDIDNVADDDGDEDGDEQEARPIVRTKHFVVMPMDKEDAAEQMELLGHDFFVFFDAETKRMGVLYRRTDGNYGLLEPELAR